MIKKEKVVKDYIYDGLGFPVLLQRVLFHQIRGEWLPKIDIEALADLAFKMLPSKPSKLTGNEIKFIRIYLNKSKPAFADIFKLSHTAITKWEKAESFFAPISPSQEMALRLYLEDYLNVGHKEFYKVYKSLETSLYSEDETPLKIAL